jgi:hypothetical protein
MQQSWARTKDEGRRKKNAELTPTLGARMLLALAASCECLDVRRAARSPITAERKRPNRPELSVLLCPTCDTQHKTDVIAPREPDYAGADAVGESTRVHDSLTSVPTKQQEKQVQKQLRHISARTISNKCDDHLREARALLRHPLNRLANRTPVRLQPVLRSRIAKHGELQQWYNGACGSDGFPQYSDNERAIQPSL